VRRSEAVISLVSNPDQAEDRMYLISPVPGTGGAVVEPDGQIKTLTAAQMDQVRQAIAHAAREITGRNKSLITKLHVVKDGKQWL